MVKKILCLFLFLTVLLALCACGAKEEAATLATEANPQSIPVAENPAEAPEAPEEPVTELMLWESFWFRYEEDSRIFDLSLNLYPLNAQFSIITNNVVISGDYTEEDGLIILNNGTEQLQLHRGEDGLTLEQGTMAAYCCGIWTEDHIYADYEGEPLSVEVGPGTVFQNPGNCTTLLDGIYVMDDSEYSAEIDEVLVDIDLTDMTFAIKCYDGYVVTGDLEFETGDYQTHLICRYDNGAVAFSVYDRWDRNDDGTIIHNPVLTASSSNTVPKGQLMYCPSENNFLDTFYFAPERNDEIVADPGFVSLDSMKFLTKEYFYFHEYVDAYDTSDSYQLGIYHFVMPDVWEFQSNSHSVQVDAVETEDGRITFSYKDKTWNFHREKGTIVFDGGDPLIIPNGYLDQKIPRKEMEMEPGTSFIYSDFGLLYDTVYILPDGNGGYQSAMRIDHENQRIVFLRADGSHMEAPFYWEDNYMMCVCAHYGPSLYAGSHNLRVHVPWGMNIAPSDSKDGSLVYIPTYSTPELEAALTFAAEVPQTIPDPAGSILVYENNLAVSIYSTQVLTGDLTLCSHDNTFTYNTEYSAYYTKGTYTEEAGIITLRHKHGTTLLRREDTSLVVVGGDPLCIAGRPFSTTEKECNELPVGTHIPLYTRGLLYNGTYTFGEDASVTFDTESHTFSLTDANGTTWEGSFTLDYKFVNCDAGSRVFQFIPYGNQVRLNQSNIEKVVPVEEDYVFFDYAQ